MVTDANGNRSAVSFSPLGFVTATAVMGKEGEPVGDTLENPGSRLEYDFFAFANRQEPVFVRSIVREHHVTETDVPLPERDATIETVEFSDGFGRLLQTRTQAEDLLFGDPTFGGGVLPPDQSSATSDTVGRQRALDDPPNVIVSGWQIYDNKGRVVEKYEPFFDTGYDYNAAQRCAARAEGHDVLRPARPGDPHAQSRRFGAAGDLWGPGESEQSRRVRAHALGGLHLRRQRSGAGEFSPHRQAAGRLAQTPDRPGTGGPSLHAIKHRDRRPWPHGTRCRAQPRCAGEPRRSLAADPGASHAEYLRHSRQCAHGDGCAGPRRLPLYL